MSATDASEVIAPRAVGAAAPVLVAGAAVALAWALGNSDGFLDPTSLAVATLAAVAAMSAPIVGRGRRAAEPAAPGRAATWATVILWVGVAWSIGFDAVVLPGYEVPRSALGPFRPVLAGAAIVLLSYAWRRAPPIVRRLRFPAIVLVAVVLGVVVIRATPRPAIDVWHFEQLGAFAIAHGIDPYLSAYPNIYGPATANYSAAVLSPDRAYVLGNPYPPLTLLLAVPAALLEADVRWTMLAAVVLSAWAIRRLGKGSTVAELAAVLLLVQPRALFVLEQSWTEPTVLAATLLVLLAVASWSDRSGTGAEGEPRTRGWIAAGLAGALALSSKQYAALVLLPVLFAAPSRGRWKAALVAIGGALAIAAPFAIWDLSAFVRSVVAFQIDQPFRNDALSWPALVVAKGGPILPVWPAFVLAAAYTVVAIRRGLDLGEAPIVGAAAWLVLVLFNKQAFCNYYWLAVGLLCSAAAWTGRAEAAAVPAEQGASPAFGSPAPLDATSPDPSRNVSG
jgi:hypothetical protein